MGLGDLVHKALAVVGISPERVERWTGEPCLCGERQEKLNQLGRWALRVLSGKTSRAEEYLERIMEWPEENEKDGTIGQRSSETKG